MNPLQPDAHRGSQQTRNSSRSQAPPLPTKSRGTDGSDTQQKLKNLRSLRNASQGSGSGPTAPPARKRTSTSSRTADEEAPVRGPREDSQRSFNSPFNGSFSSSSSSSLDLAIELAQSTWVMMFVERKYEVLFLIEEYYRCRWRLALSATIWAFTAGLYQFVRPDLDYVLNAVAAGSGITAGLQFCLIFADRCIVQPKEEADDEDNTDERIIVTRRSFVPMSNTMDTTEMKRSYKNNKKERLFHPYREVHAYLQELLASAYTLFQAVLLTYLMAEVQNVANCHHFYNYQNLEHTRTKCPLRANQFLFWGNFLAIIVGQPRFLVVAFGYLVAFVTALIAHSLHDMSMAGKVIFFILYGIFLLALSVLKYFNESQLRKRFVLRQVVKKQRKEAEEGNKALKAFVLQITPKHLHSKLRDPSGILTANATALGTCMVVQVHDSLSFIHSVLPAQAASVFSFFFVSVASEAPKVGLEHIRTHGDVAILVNGLVSSSSSTSSSFSRTSTTMFRLHAVLTLALSLKHMARRCDAKLNIACGLAQGTLVGMPLGSSCIRYDLFGSALSKATALAGSCEKNKVHVDVDICTRAEQNEQVALHCRDETENKTETLAATLSGSTPTSAHSSSTTSTSLTTATTTTTSISIDAGTPLGGLEGGTSVGGRMVGSISKTTTSTTRHRSVSTGDSFSLATADRSRSSSSTQHNSHLSTENSAGSDMFVPTNQEAGMKNLLTSSDDFDPIAAITVTHPSTAPPHGPVEASTISIATSSPSIRFGPQTSSKISKLCCLRVSEFADPQVQARASQKLLEESTSSFFHVNLFMALLTAVCCVSVGEERGPAADEDVAALSAYFSLTGICCILFSITAMFLWKRNKIMPSPPSTPMHNGEESGDDELPVEATLQQPPGPSLTILSRVCVGAMFLSLIASHFARRSVVGDDPAFLLFAICLLVMHIGLPTKFVMAFQLCCFLAGYYIPLFLYRPVILRASFLTMLPVITIINATLVNNEVDVTLFAQVIESKAAIAEVGAQHRVQQRILASIVPSRLHYIFENTKSLFTAKHHRLECWSEDDVVVLHICVGSISGDLADHLAMLRNKQQGKTAASLQNSRSRSQEASLASVPGDEQDQPVTHTNVPTSHPSAPATASGGSATTPTNSSTPVAPAASERRYVGVNDEPSQHAAVIPATAVEAIKRNAEETTGLIETLTANVTHKTLDIVKVLGETIVVAGPIRNTDNACAPSSGSGRSTQNSTGPFGGFQVGDSSSKASSRNTASNTNTGSRSKSKHNKSVFAEILVHDAVQDTLELVGGLMAAMFPQQAAAAKENTKGETGGDDDEPRAIVVNPLPMHNDSEEPAAPFTDTSFSCKVGISIEQAINCLIIKTNPSFDLLGPAVNIAKAITDAAPAPRMIVATEKFSSRAQLLEEERKRHDLCDVDEPARVENHEKHAKGSNTSFDCEETDRTKRGGGYPNKGGNLASLVSFSTHGESWRLRDFGTVRVNTLRMKRQGQM